MAESKYKVEITSVDAQMLYAAMNLKIGSVQRAINAQSDEGVRQALRSSYDTYIELRNRIYSATKGV